MKKTHLTPKMRQDLKTLREIHAERLRLEAVKADPAKAMKNFKARQRERMRNLKDPDYMSKRAFPRVTDGWSTTQEYVRLFQALNGNESVGHRLTFVLAGEAK